MPARFDFISPGILLNEIDESKIPETVNDELGPVIVGRSLTGPAMKPVRVKNLEDFNTIFGKGISGKGTQDNDVWRKGNLVGPTYAVYAAQAHLASETTPVTFVRLLGEASTDASTDAQLAGWNIADAGNPSATVADNKSAYGLFIIQSGALGQLGTAAQTTPKTGSLAAIFYVNGGGVALSGVVGPQGNPIVQSTASTGVLVNSLGATANTFKLNVYNAAGAISDTITFDFTQGSKNYIRDVFNTNPQLLQANTNFGLTDKTYFLGETFEESVHGFTSTTAGAQMGIIMALDSGSLNFGDHKVDVKAPQTGWIFNRRPTQEKLFRVISLHDGEWMQNNYHINIRDLALGDSVVPNSTFTIEVVDSKTLSVVESFSSLNVDPSSENFVSKIIGDQRLEWDATDKKYNVRGEYPNNSDYIRIEVSTAVQSQQLQDRHAIPFGFYGPLRAKSFALINGSAVQAKSDDALSSSIDFNQKSVVNGKSLTFPYPVVVAGLGQTTGAGAEIAALNPLSGEIALPHFFTGAFNFPSLKLTTQDTNYNGNSFPATALQGVRHHLGTGRRRDDSFVDLVRILPSNATVGISHFLGESESPPNSHEFSFIFSLDDIRQDATNTDTYYFESGSYGAETSYTFTNGASGLLDKKLKQFTIPFFGGHDGLNLKEVEPFANRLLQDQNRKASYAYNSVFKALETISDPEVLEYDIITVPGIYEEDVTNEVIDIADSRRDCLAIIDLDGGHKPGHENNGTVTAGGVNTTITSLEGRLINTSYAAAYYPWVLIRDRVGGQADSLFVPPSVAAVGALAKSQGLSELWFAPAGFNRGGINELGGPDGPIVIGTWEHLAKSDRDDLYQANINPIARFPSMDQIVVFGQKTLQREASALDRINVRRLLNYLKFKIGKIANSTLFDQNVQSTWNRFKFRANRVLADVQSRVGISEYRLVLDNKTTTEDLVDRNILYAKIFIKPTKSIEFIAIDFVVTRSGVDF